MASPASAQNLGGNNAAEAARQTTQQTDSAFQPQSLPLGVNAGSLAQPTPGNLDLGIQEILKRKEVEQPFRFFLDVAGFYTNNVALVPAGKQGDSYLFTDIGFTYDQKLNDEWSVESTIRQGFFQYEHFTTFDFQDFNLGGGLTYQSKKLWNTAFFARYNFERFTKGDLSEDFFRNNTVTVGAQKTFFFNQYQYAYVGYSSVFGWATPSNSQRDEHGFFAGVHYNFDKKFYAEVYDRVACFNYSVGRTDLNETVVATLAYVFNDYARVTASFTYVTDRSNHSAFDYGALTTGGGLALQLRF
ncbi:MAG TPA: hypothetical protein VG733_04555 [Chthoniobacteraceae bacterium]|nr:hypothetical protein [Chthoniobacteraceae bacterium]